MDIYPIEVNTAPLELLLRVPGIGVTSANRIIVARKAAKLDYRDLKKIGVVLKRAQYFITCNGKVSKGVIITPDSALRALISERCQSMLLQHEEQLSLFQNRITREDVVKCITGQI